MQLIMFENLNHDPALNYLKNIQTNVVFPRLGVVKWDPTSDTKTKKFIKIDL